MFVDLRSMKENDLHGSGMRLLNTKKGVQLTIKRFASGSGQVKCQISILSDTQFKIVIIVSLRVLRINEPIPDICS